MSSATPTERVIAAIEAKTGHARKRAGREFKLICPSHDDHTPSLNVREGDAGTPIIVCRSHGCTPAQVLEAVGLTWGDILGSSELWTPFGEAVTPPYRYVDENGVLLYEVLRTASKEFPVRRPDASKSHGHEWRMGDRRVLYRLPQVLAAAAAGETVYVVEGEKAVESLERRGYTATTSPGGAGKWRKEYAECLRGAHVVIVADKDDSGRAHARMVAASLQGIAASVRVLEAAVEQEKAGADDHLAAGFTLEQLIPLQLDDSFDDEPRIDLASAESDAPTSSCAFQVEPLEVFIADEEAVTEPLIGTDEKKLVTPSSNVVFFGEGGAGKTTLAIDVGFHAAAGDEWLGFEIARPLVVLLIENEGPRQEFRAKLRRKEASWAGSPVEGRIHVTTNPWGRVDLRDEDHIAALAETIARLHIDVVIAGPIRRLGVEGGGTPAETTAFMALLERVRTASGLPVATILVHHENKSGDISGAFVEEFDTVIHVEAADRNRTKIFFRKSRWSSRIHRSRALLAWLPDTEGFTLIESDIDGDRAAAVAARRNAEDAAALEWLIDHVTQHHTGTGAGLPRGNAEKAYTSAYLVANPGTRGARARIRRVIDAQKMLAVRLAEGATQNTNGEHSPSLAIVNGEKAGAILLYPLNHAPSPLAEAQTARTASTTDDPPQEPPLASSPPPIEIGGERRAPGGEGAA